jgi:hypothetical protein
MSLVGHLDVGRSDRVAVDRAGTLRDRAKTPIDVVVDNLSTTGCLFLLDRELPLGALVSIGIPGIGIRYARISRVDHPQYACAFLAPVGEDEIAAALSAETLVAGAFPQLPSPVVPIRPTVEAEEPHARKLRFGMRVAVIVGVSAALWAAIIAGVIAIAR